MRTRKIPAHMYTILRVLSALHNCPRAKILADRANISPSQLSKILFALKECGVQYHSIKGLGYRVIHFGIFNIDEVNRILRK